ncbi:hypothetical protein MW290_24620 [Aquincola tertiaricarbonis]|uniref:Transposase n=1 Tax=Aquincola tertiaricarbonis TaxID=391953 RepID=A0ABY4S6Z6_AQUTE|nr:hypothetical protein [Aquincola tertiaricarbonis]URI08764.1 hypothetical protein MW290_24620 [Aquincola tertiaricarbonis]
MSTPKDGTHCAEATGGLSSRGKPREVDGWKQKSRLQGRLTANLIQMVGATRFERATYCSQSTAEIEQRRGAQADPL